MDEMNNFDMRQSMGNTGNTINSSLPECADKEEARDAWDPSTCCFTCKRKPATPKPKHTKDDVRRCLGQVPVCDDPSQVLHDRKHACPACKRPERLCKQEDVAKCRADTPDCEEGVRPMYVKGECCKSCKPVRPVCEPSCTDIEVCVSRNGTNTCKPKLSLKIQMKITDIKRRATLENMTKEEVVELIKSFVDRFCDNVDNADRCDKVKELVFSSMRPKDVTSTDGTVTVDVDLAPDSAAPARRRLLEAGSIVEDAVADAEATDGFTVTTGGASTDGTTGGTDSVSGASSVVPGGAFLLLVALFF